MEKDVSTEQRIINAARKVFIQKGMSGARMQDIADEAGINKALLHYYFRSKDKLFQIIFREAAEKLLVTVKDITGNETPLEEKITALCNRYMDVLSENPYLPLFVLHEIHQDPGRIINFFKGKNMVPQLQKFFLQIQDAVDNRRIKPISPPQLVINIISLCVFPFAASPLMQTLFDLDTWQFNLFIEERKKKLPEFILAALKPEKNDLLSMNKHP